MDLGNTNTIPKWVQNPKSIKECDLERQTLERQALERQTDRQTEQQEEGKLMNSH